MSTATKRQAESAAKKVGATIKVMQMWIDFDMPIGKVLKSNGFHYNTYYYGYDEAYINRGEVYAQIVEDCEYGAEDCDIENCEICEEEKENVESNRS